MKTAYRSRAALSALLVLCALGVQAAPDPVLPRAQPAAVGLSPERLERLEHYVAGEVAALHKAGAVVLIARRGQIAYLKAFGSADLASGRPLAPNAIFRVYSMTKPVTSVALLTLYEQGKFQLSDPLEKYLPAFKGVRVFKSVGANGELELEDAQRPITIEDVFRHTAGFVYGLFADTPVDRAYRTAGIDYGKVGSVGELTQKIATMPLLHQPGTHWVYSFAHDVQAALVEHFSGMPFDAYCQKVIFGPLGMKDSMFGVPQERAARFAAIYHPGPEGQLLAGDGWSDGDLYTHFTGHPFGGVGLSTTVEDYLRFAQMLLDGGRLGGVRILSRKTVELMRVDHLAPEATPVAPGLGYGLGVGVVTDPAHFGRLSSAGQFFWSGYATTAMFIDPKEQMVALVFAQYLPEDFRFIDDWSTLVYQAIDD